ncbi:MAG: hypothetical protein IIY49_03875 [Eubacterium sp.]|nr:hypothetical protein [Eubacterium sp.]
MRLEDSTSKAGKKLGSYTKKMGATIVVIALAITCFASVTGEKMREAGEYGRMISVSSLSKDSKVETQFAKVSYTEIENIRYEADQKADLKIAEKNDSEVLLAQQQADKDRAALQAILEADKNSSETKDAAKAQSEKYSVNVIAEVPTEAPTESASQSTETTYSASAEPIYVSVDGVSSGTYLGQFVTTAYCPCVVCCGKTNGITASGAHAQANHTIATDSRFDFGTQLVIDGQVYTVEDRGGAIQGNRIDIFFNTHQEALNYGRRTVDVYAY